MADTPLGSAIEFLHDFGFYDVVLPFLLVFTIIFAVLEKTKIFGTEGGKPKKNINAMIAFVIALMFVATTNLVIGTKEFLPNVVILLITLMSFMMLVGFFYADKEFSFEKHKSWKILLTLIFFIGIVLMSWHAYAPESFKWFFEETTGFWTSQGGATVIFLIIIIITILVVTMGKKSSGGGDD